MPIALGRTVLCVITVSIGIGVSSAEMVAHCRINKNSGSGAVEGTIAFSQQVCILAAL